MIVRIEYEGGRTTLFDTLSFTEGSPFSGANMLTEFELEMREEPEKGLWLTANWHQVRDDWRADAPADGIPAARRSRGWRFMLASEAELGHASRVLLDGDEVFARVRGAVAGCPVKPAPDGVQALMAAMGADPARTLYVGDSNVDIYTAHNAKLPGCGAVWGFRGRDELLAAGADVLADTPEDLANVVLG